MVATLLFVPSTYMVNFTQLMASSAVFCSLSFLLLLVLKYCHSLLQSVYSTLKTALNKIPKRQFRQKYTAPRPKTAFYGLHWKKGLT